MAENDMVEKAASEPSITLYEAETLALAVLSQGPDEIGIIDSEEKMAAAMMFIELERRGFLTRTQGEDGPIWDINEAGLAELQRRQAYSALSH